MCFFENSLLKHEGSGMIMSPSLRGSPSMPLMQSRFMNPTRPGMMGYGIGMVIKFLCVFLYILPSFVIASMN